MQLGGPGSGLSLVSPTKVKARKSFLFTEGSLKVEIKSCHILHEVTKNCFSEL